MPKLKLHLEDLQVDTFQTTAPERPKGTVFGEQCTCWTNCGQNTCPGCPTCDASCNGTCANTCDASCNGSSQCSGYDTCWYSCMGSCPPDTCDMTCPAGMTCYLAAC